VASSLNERYIPVSCQRARQVLLNRHYVSIDAALVVMSAAFNLSVFHCVRSAPASRNDVSPLNTATAGAFASVLEVALLTVGQRNLHFHAVRLALSVVNRPVKYVIDAPWKLAVPEQVQPIPKDLAHSPVPVFFSGAITPAKVCSVDCHAKPQFFKSHDAVIL
jgi:hypothetical protein